ncbi:MAG: arginine biosynthesis bifunctional protein ArgJ [Herpetosiphonaceae bacterium]|nr:MAG: arginine biosynthesis bifunctional protein ArgJ [Herpetosiphonaceae bacterium]
MRDESEQVASARLTPVVPGFKAAGISCGIKRTGAPDLALIVVERPCAAAALFTTNLVKAAPVLYDQAILARPGATIGAVVINSGNANACTGAEGEAAVRATAEAAAGLLGIAPEQVFVMSTGVIGVPLPVERLIAGLPQAVQQLQAEGWDQAARAMMTTDTRPKIAQIRVPLPSGVTIHLAGIAKGAGMIHPNMATLLSVVATDALIEPETLRQALRLAADRSFHCISVDGDTSTNDTLLALASGTAGNLLLSSLTAPGGAAFLAGLTALCRDLALQVVRDGEGATRVATIVVRGAASDAEAHRAAMTVATSPLVKTALHGADPNWGRVLAALGRSGVTFDPQRVALDFGGIAVLRDGRPLLFDEVEAHRRLSGPDVLIEADLRMGEGSATVWTCDFSDGYVRINADYRT